jgi:hypothetical protein
MAYTPTFGDWTAVAATYGDAAAQALQQQGIPLSQVAQYINQTMGSNATYGPGGQFNMAPEAGNVSSIQNNPVVTGPQGIQQTLGGLINFGQGGGGQQAPPNLYNNSIIGNPLYSLSQLGAAALQQPMIVNPNPSQQPINAQGGVFSGQQLPMVSSTVPKAPAGPWMNTPGLFGAPGPMPSGGPGVPPTAQTPLQSQFQPIQPYGGVSGGGNRSGPGTPMAVPPPAPSIQFPGTGPASGMPPSAPGIGGPNPTRDGLTHPWTVGGTFGANPTTPGTSIGSMALQNVPAAIKMQSGGKVSGNTDTVPAMLTPGEYVINKDAAQKLGRDNLDQLNKGKGLGAGLFQHLQTGGEVTGTDTDASSAATDSAAYQWALNQLPATEKAVLQQPTMAGSMNPLAMQAQKDLQNLISQYTSRSSATKTTPSPKAPSGEKTPQTTPSAMGQQTGQPQTPFAAPQTGAGATGPGAYWPQGSTVYPGNYVMGPNQPGSAPGTSTGDILATGNQATATPQAGPTPQQQQQLGALAGGISSIGQGIAQAFQNNAKLSWQDIPAGAWANPAAYESQEQRYYGQYQNPMSQLQIV